ncbi:MAG: hypothetical protein HY746_03615 [Elusimicrobia bacterium]|nr:hypothetical protein [Elusimicrobiota bacterium]
MTDKNKKEINSPRLRTVDKVRPPFPLNEFPRDFGYRLGREIVYLLATKGKGVLEGPEWEEIFANCIGAEWKPSNVGLDDVILSACAWGAKTVKSPNPIRQTQVRLISGRNAPAYSFRDSKGTNVNPNTRGEQVLCIWNERVSAIREKYKHLRTVVLIKSDDLSELVVFEFETVRYEPDLFSWRWNARKNLEGFVKSAGEHKFTWQPHGSQFTIIEHIPPKNLLIKLKSPQKLDKDVILRNLGFNNAWVKVLRRND